MGDRAGTFEQVAKQLLEPVTLTGELVILAPLTFGDIDAVYDAVGDAYLWRLSSSAMHDRGDMAVHVERELTATDNLAWKTVDAQTGVVIGCTNLHRWRPRHRVGEIGTTRVALDRQGTGVNTEAKYLQLRYCFETLDAHRIEFCIDTRNERSQAAVRKIGATFEGIHRRHQVLHDGYVRDTAWYAITDEDWPAVKPRLEELIAARR